MKLKWYWYVVCSILIVVGIFSMIRLIQIFNVKSGEYGTAITIEQKNDYVEVSKFDFGSLVFDTEDYSNYSLVTTVAPQKFDGIKNDYILLFNGQPLNNIVVNAGKIAGDFVQDFYDVDGNVVTTSVVHVLVEYLDGETRCTLSTLNNNNSIAYLTTYSQINGAIVKVVQRG